MIQSNEMGKWFNERIERVMDVVWTVVKVVFCLACSYFMLVTWQFYRNIKSGKIAELARVVEASRARNVATQTFIADIQKANCEGIMMDDVLEKYNIPLNCEEGAE